MKSIIPPCTDCILTLLVSLECLRGIATSLHSTEKILFLTLSAELTQLPLMLFFYLDSKKRKGERCITAVCMAFPPICSWNYFFWSEKMSVGVIWFCYFGWLALSLDREEEAMAWPKALQNALLSMKSQKNIIVILMQAGNVRSKGPSTL